MTADTIFALHSMTKPITCLAAMMLVDEGKLSPSDPVSKYIPAFAGVKVGIASKAADGAPGLTLVPPDRPVTVEDLLRQTSGITYDYIGGQLIENAYHDAHIFDGHFDNREFAERIARLPLARQPGTVWRYGHSTDVVGRVVEIVSGKSLYQFMKERIFDPLGMNDTDFFVPAGKAHRFAACYSADSQGAMTFHATNRKGGLTLQDDPTKSSFLSPPSFTSGGGGLCSTAADYLTFCRALINGGELGGARLIGPKTLALMTSNHLPGGRTLPEMSRSLFSEATYHGIGFGLGFSVTLDPAQTLILGSPGEYAWGGAATTSFWIDPAEELIAIFMTQVLPSSAYPIRRELRTMVYAAITDSNL
jgi:CubicO group peptidase (beta-lactamase class C family)